METNEINLSNLLKDTVDSKATDLHLSVGAKPKVRINGNIQDLKDYDILTQTVVTNLCYSILTEKQKRTFESTKELDFSFSQRGISRFRGNLYYNRGSITGVFRVIPHEIRRLENLGLPKKVNELIFAQKGLILVTGTTGSGKTTSLAAMIQAINEKMYKNIITVEDPIEYVFPHINSLVNQREVGEDTDSFGNALRHILREDPDVVLIGEIRDLETMRAALSISETGHLTFGTLHTNSATQTISRILDMFPSEEQAEIKTSLSLSLLAIISQSLVHAKNSQDRVLASELLVMNSAIRNLIREGKMAQIYSQIVGNSGQGMQTMNQCLAELVDQDLIDRDEAELVSEDKQELISLIDSGIKRTQF